MRGKQKLPNCLEYLGHNSRPLSRFAFVEQVGVAVLGGEVINHLDQVRDGGLIDVSHLGKLGGFHLDFLSRREDLLMSDWR